MLLHRPLGFIGNRRASSLRQIPRPQSLISGPPHGLPFQTSHRRHPRLATLPPLDHALEHFEGVEPVDIQPGKPNRHRLLHRGFQLVLDPRLPPTHRQRRSPHKRRSHRLRPLVHPQRISPAIGQVLVVKHRHPPLRRRHHPADLLHKVASRIELLLLFVPGVIPVLANGQDPIHSQLLSPETQRRRDAVKNRHPMLLGHRPSHIAFGKLVDIHRRDLDPRRAQALVRGKSLEELGDDHVGVRPRAIFGDDRRDFLFAHFHFPT